MKPPRWIPLAALSLLVAAAIAGLVWTRDAGQAMGGGPSHKVLRGKDAQPPPAGGVDESPLTTARSLAPFATTPEEQDLLHQAERLGNHEVDLAFTDALLQAVETPLKLTPEAAELLAQNKKADAAVETDQARIKQLIKQVATAHGAEQDDLEDQLDVAKAQLELDQDELDDAAAELEAAGGDPQAKIRRLKAAHEATDKATLNTAQASVTPWSAPSGSLITRAGVWFQLRKKVARLNAAHQDVVEKAQHLSQRRPVFAKRVEQKKEDRKAAKEKAAGFAQQGHGEAAGSSKEAAKAAITSLKNHMRDQRTLVDLGKRLQDQRELGEVYERWIGLAWAHERAALHSVLESLLGILLVILGVYLGGRLIEHSVDRADQDRKRASTFQTLAKLALQLVGAVAILFVIVGIPTQTTTFLGLAGAGLTVAMKDFIVAFFGWFVLMGRNGLRVGDWVEIQGVGGEVIEVGLLRTVLLETGNWSDAAHPTGRQVAFMNSFAIEGHFFNFSTSGQWMWDELRALIPTGQDPYPIIAGIQKLVEKQTEANAKLAEQEWHRATTRYRVQAFSTVPGIHVLTVPGGIEVRVRYITRAYESHETRGQLNQAVMDLLQGHGGEALAKPEPVSS